MYRICTILLVSILALTIRTEAQQFFGEAGFAEFESRAPALTFTGVSNHLIGLIDLAEGTVDFYLDLNTLDTGISLRNRHMRDSYLRTNQFPFAEFKGRFSEGMTADPTEAGAQTVQVQGEFTIHGVTRERTVDGTLTFSEDGQQVLLEAAFEVALDDHNISRPRVVFLELSEVQRVRIRVQMERYND